MDFEWDESKRLANILKHGIDFVDAIGIFTGHVTETEDQRRDYGEHRFLVTGELNDEVIRLVYTKRDERWWIISARRAKRNERRAYYEGHPGRGAEDERPD